MPGRTAIHFSKQITFFIIKNAKWKGPVSREQESAFSASGKSCLDSQGAADTLIGKA